MKPSNPKQEKVVKEIEMILVEIHNKIMLLNSVKDPICRSGYDHAKREARHIIKEYILQLTPPLPKSRQSNKVR
jgi:hypothetical protein